MTKVVITHGYSRQNKGDDAIVSAMAHVLRSVVRDPRFTIVSVYHDQDIRFPEGRFFDAKDYNVEMAGALFPSPRLHLRPGHEFGKVASLLTFGVFLLRYFLLLFLIRISPRAGMWVLGPRSQKTLQHFLDADLVAVKGGGFLYSHGGAEELSLVMAMNPILLATALGKSVILFPNSIGPFRTRFSRWLARAVLNQVDTIMVREERSGAEVHRLGITRPKTVLVPDIAFALPPTQEGEGKRLLARAGVPEDVVRAGRLVGVTVRPWHFPGSGGQQERQRRYLITVATMIEKLIELGARVVLIPQVTGPAEAENDTTVTRQLFQLVQHLRPGVHMLEGDFDPAQLKAMYGEMEMFVGTRMHSCIFAMSSGVPTLAISYMKNKAFGIMEMVGMEDCVVDITALSEGRGLDLVERIWSRRRELGHDLSAVMVRVREWIQDEVRKEADRLNISQQSSAREAFDG